MSNVKVEAGICGFATKICVERVEDVNAKMGVKITIESECPVIRKVAQKLDGVLDGLEEIGRGLANSKVYRTSAECKAHAACPVPCGIMKCIEVALELALPMDAHIYVER